MWLFFPLIGSNLSRMPQISVIVPVYNAERTLHRCVDSILAQTCRDFELLLINDGSTDGSGKICDEYAAKDARIRVFHKGNGGVSSARNVGLDEARGEWIAFCDSDDWVDAEWLEIFFGKLGYNVGMVIQGFFPHGKQWNYKTGLDYYGAVEECILKLSENNILGYLWSKIFKKSIVMQRHLKFDSEIAFREDELFCLKYMEGISCICSVSKQGYHYSMPNYATKYSHCNYFDIFMKNFLVLERIFHGVDNRLIRIYVEELTQSLFSSFSERDSNRKQNLIHFKEKVGKNVLCVKSLSLCSRYLLAYTPSVTFMYSLLEVKEWYRRCLK